MTRGEIQTMTNSERQLAFVVDLNKCMGCHTCSVACKMFYTNDRGADHQWWMKVNTLPGRGYPKDWEQMGGGYDADGRLRLGKRPAVDDYGGDMQFNYEEVFFGGTGQRAHLAPQAKPTWGPNWDEDVGGGTYPNAYFFYLPRMCNHCWRPACADACALGAITKRADDGLVTVDESRCERCAAPACMDACPYKEIYWNPIRHAAQKCHGCASRVDEGVAPVCVRQCPGRCVWVGFLDDEGGPVHRLVKEWQVALPLHGEFNTGPNVYYVPVLAPPRLDANGRLDERDPRIPTEYLRSLFGPKVDAALDRLESELAKRRREPKEPSELMDILIARRWGENLGPFQRDPSEVTAL